MREETAPTPTNDTQTSINTQAAILKLTSNIEHLQSQVNNLHNSVACIAQHKASRKELELTHDAVKTATEAANDLRLKYSDTILILDQVLEVVLADSEPDFLTGIAAIADILGKHERYTAQAHAARKLLA
jgi:cell division protein ZapA (FtsZ GTPase activity inhibitor)